MNLASDTKDISELKPPVHSGRHYQNLDTGRSLRARTVASGGAVEGQRTVSLEPPSQVGHRAAQLSQELLTLSDTFRALSQSRNLFTMGSSVNRACALGVGRRTAWEGEQGRPLLGEA